jgi:hypothetical protein
MIPVAAGFVVEGELTLQVASPRSAVAVLQFAVQ